MIFNQQLDNEEYPTTVASLNGESLENVVIYRYLGCDIKYNESSTGDTELNLRTDAATNKFYSNSKNLLNQKIYLKTRVLMVNSTDGLEHITDDLETEICKAASSELF